MLSRLINLFIAIIILQCHFDVKASPTFTFLRFTKRQANEEPTERPRPEPGLYTRVKPFSGIKLRNDTIRMLYYNEQTIAIAEISRDKLLVNCELIEVVDENDAAQVLDDLSYISRPLAITLPEMIKFMSQCEELDPLNFNSGIISHETTVKPSVPPFSFLKGIVPGTKWCGTGDIATNYHDLGEDKDVDKCCRVHDICPVKVLPHQKRYNLTNNSIYTKSYCDCDDQLFNCLKKANSSTAQLMGNIYFNLLEVACIAEDANSSTEFHKYFKKPVRKF